MAKKKSYTSTSRIADMATGSTLLTVESRHKPLTRISSAEKAKLLRCLLGRTSD